MLNGLCTAAGHGLAGFFAAAKRVRPVRPIHPAGLHLQGRLERHDNSFESGIPWVDTPGSDEVEARLSRSLGLPAGWPDVIGLALRVGIQDGPADILLSSTGMSRAGRYLLLMHRDARAAALTTLMPYEGAFGPVQLAARSLRPHLRLPAEPDGFRQALGGSEWVLGLYHGRPDAGWHRFGTMALRPMAGGGDSELRFDPILHPVPGAATYRWTEVLREPSYAVAQDRQPGDGSV